jgi:autonomous glycyl radical cofactor GrcA
VSEEVAKRVWLTPIKVGLILSCIVLVGFIVMSFQRNCILLETSVLECRENWERFWASKPNEIGDTLAGFAGTLAFIWIVVTVWLQSTELAEQREVLREQKEEFKLMVSAQNAQVRALEAQAAVFEHEKTMRVEAGQDQLVNSLLWALERDIVDAVDTYWDISDLFGHTFIKTDYRSGAEAEKAKLEFENGRKSRRGTDEFFPMMEALLQYTIEEIEAGKKENRLAPVLANLREPTEVQGIISKLVERTGSIEDEMVTASKLIKLKVESLKIKHLQTRLSSLQKLIRVSPQSSGLDQSP